MPRISIVATGALFSAIIFVSGMTTGSAVAQTATGQAGGSPLQLLKVAGQPTKTSHTRHLARSVSKATIKTKVAARKERRHHHRIMLAAKRRHAPVAVAEAAPPQVAETAPPPAPANGPAPGAAAPAASTSASIWPAVPTAPTEVAAASPTPPASAPANPPNPPKSELDVGGEKVQLASPNEVNAIDLAANNRAAEANDAASAAAHIPAMSDTAAAAQIPDSMKSAPTPQHAPIGSASWIMQVLAALGGALTAGSVAWFLIGGAPQRTYG
jgi:hypothetical protein